MPTSLQKLIQFQIMETCMVHGFACCQTMETMS